MFSIPYLFLERIGSYFGSRSMQPVDVFGKNETLINQTFLGSVVFPLSTAISLARYVCHGIVVAQRNSRVQPDLVLART